MPDENNKISPLSLEIVKNGETIKQKNNNTYMSSLKSDGNFSTDTIFHFNFSSKNENYPVVKIFYSIGNFPRLYFLPQSLTFMVV
jgi:hypothetical protein